MAFTMFTWSLMTMGTDGKFHLGAWKKYVMLLKLRKDFHAQQGDMYHGQEIFLCGRYSEVEIELDPRCNTQN